MKNRIRVCTGNRYAYFTMRMFDKYLHANRLFCVRGRWVVTN